MKNPFWAKSYPQKETIKQHTEGLLSEYDTLKKLYPEIKYLNWEILKIACTYHDLGKMNTKFQNRLGAKLSDQFPSIKEIHHGYLSPAFLPKEKLKSKFNEDELRILYQSIYYHHSRDKIDNSEELKVIIKGELLKYRDEFEFDRIDKTEKLYSSYVKYTTDRRIPDCEDTPETFYQYVITKGLLNKIDYAASAHIEVEIKNEDLEEKTLNFLNGKYNGPNELQTYMLNNQDKNNIIIASTGIGKTEASLLWIGNNKGIFTLPLKVSINSIYDRVISKIGFKNCALLHSETYSEYLKRNNNELDIDYYEKTKQMSMPLTICTLDQIIDFIFKYEGFEIKLATLAYSKLIIDEIQMYSPELLGYLIVSLKYITSVGGKFTIVTATMPEIIVDLLKEEGISFSEPKVFLKKNKLRHRMKVLEEDINIDEIIKNYKDKKVLVIVNTVKKAQEIYDALIEKLSNEVSINLFHARFIRRDRDKKESKIIEMGQNENVSKGIWVTTQIVEASLDIDFDVLYTELSDVSGLFQRMGRIYRNREKGLENGVYNVFVYVGGENRTSGVGTNETSIIDYQIFDLSKKVILNYDNKEITEEEKIKIVKEVYSKEKLLNTDYYNKIKDTIKDASDIIAFTYESQEINLRKISNELVMPLNIYNENFQVILDNLDIIKNSKNRKEKEMAKEFIKQFILGIPPYEYLYAKKIDRIIKEIEIDKHTIVKVLDYDYNFNSGLISPKKSNKYNIENRFY